MLGPTNQGALGNSQVERPSFLMQARFGDGFDSSDCWSSLTYPAFYFGLYRNRTEHAGNCNLGVSKFLIYRDLAVIHRTRKNSLKCGVVEVPGIEPAPQRAHMLSSFQDLNCRL